MARKIFKVACPCGRRWPVSTPGGEPPALTLICSSCGRSLGPEHYTEVAVTPLSLPIERGEVIQIDPGQGALGGCFAIVTEVKPWGVEAKVPLTHDSTTPVRLEHEEFVRIGKAEWSS